MKINKEKYTYQEILLAVKNVLKNSSPWIVNNYDLRFDSFTQVTMATQLKQFLENGKIDWTLKPMGAYKRFKKLYNQCSKKPKTPNIIYKGAIILPSQRKGRMENLKINITKEEIAKVMYKTNFPDFEETENHNHKMYLYLAKAILDYVKWRLVND